MKTVMNHSHDGWLLKMIRRMIRRTDPMIQSIFILSLQTIYMIKAYENEDIYRNGSHAVGID